MKTPLKSKTIWFNIVLVLAGMFVPDQSDVVRGILVSTGLSNMGLRVVTGSPLKKVGVKSLLKAVWEMIRRK